MINATQGNSCNARNSRNKQTRITFEVDGKWDNVYGLKSPLQMFTGYYELRKNIARTHCGAFLCPPAGCHFYISTGEV